MDGPRRGLPPPRGVCPHVGTANRLRLFNGPDGACVGVADTVGPR